MLRFRSNRTLAYMRFERNLGYVPTAYLVFVQLVCAPRVPLLVSSRALAQTCTGTMAAVASTPVARARATSCPPGSFARAIEAGCGWHASGAEPGLPIAFNLGSGALTPMSARL